MFRKNQPDENWPNTQTSLKNLCERIFEIELQCVGQSFKFCNAIANTATYCRVMMVVLKLGESPAAPSQAVRVRKFSPEEQSAIIESWGRINDDAFKLANPVLKALLVGSKGHKCFCNVGNSIVRTTLAIQNEKTFGYPNVGTRGGFFN